MSSLTRAVEVPLAPEESFRQFTQGFGRWWPAEYTWAGESLERIAIEPREGGRCFERGPDGFEADWGRVLAWQPPERLVFTWQISERREPVPDAARASEVEVRFVALDAQSTRVELEHRGFERHGDGGDGYRAAMDSERGWPYLLDRFAAAAQTREDPGG